MSNLYRIDPVERGQFLDKAMRILYAATQRYMDQKLGQVIKANSAAHGNNQPCLMYKGRFYSNARINRFYTRVNAMHRDVRPQMKEWLEENEKLDEERQIASTYILAVLQLSSHKDALRKTLPEAFHAMIDTYAHHLTVLTPPPASEEDLAQFMEKNQQYYLLLKRRLTMNLLEGG